MEKKRKKVSIFYDATIQKREGEQVDTDQKLFIFEEGEGDVAKVRECFGGGVKVYFKDGVVSKYKGFKYCITK